MTYQEIKAKLLAKPSRNKPHHLEEDLQMQCVRWFDLSFPQYASLLHHSPNGGKRNAREAARFKSMGTRAGFPDLILLLPCGERPYLCLELKVGNNKQTELQMRYQTLVEHTGGKYAVIRSLEEFRRTVIEYMSATKPQEEGLIENL